MTINLTYMQPNMYVRQKMAGWMEAVTGNLESELSMGQCRVC